MPAPDFILIGLTGRAGAGKDTAADHLCQRYGFERASFAEALKVMLEALFAHCGIDHAWLHEPALKNQPIPELHGTVSARTLMQTLGTEWGRQAVGSDFWVRILDRHLGLSAGAPVHDRIVVTDVRFPSEAHWLRQLQGGHLVRLVRDAAPLPGAAGLHPSESYVDAFYVDHAIANHGFTPDTLHARLDDLMSGLGLDERPPLRGFGREA